MQDGFYAKIAGSPRGFQDGVFQVVFFSERVVTIHEGRGDQNTGASQAFSSPSDI